MHLARSRGHAFCQALGNYPLRLVGVLAGGALGGAVENALQRALVSCALSWQIAWAALLAGPFACQTYWTPSFGADGTRVSYEICYVRDLLWRTRSAMEDSPDGLIIILTA